jgi:hypothetical protein
VFGVDLSRPPAGKIYLEPIPKLRAMSPYLEFGIINHSCDIENSFQTLMMSNKYWFWDELRDKIWI